MFTLKKIFKKSKSPKISTIRKVNHNVYIINDCVSICVKEDGEIKADYDPDVINEDQVNQIIDDFFGMLLK